jgi:hypothetical protein
MELALEDPTVLARYVPTIPESASLSNSLSNITNIADNSRYQPKSRDPKGKAKGMSFYDRMVEFEARSAEDIDRLMKSEEEKRNKKVLLHLDALCVSNDAKKSLWEWQLAYARTARNEKYLPQGGRMVGQEKGGWVSRMGWMVNGGMSASGSLSSLGRRSGLGALVRRKGNVMGLGQHAEEQQTQGRHVYGPLGQAY